MKKFQYNMENILQVKLKLEDQAKIAYGIARTKLTKEEDKLRLLKERQASYEEEQRCLRQAKLDIRKIIHMEEAIEVMRQKIQQQRTAVKTAAQRLEVARIRLNDAMVDRKTQETLKEKAWSEYLLEFDAEERKEIDELTSFTYSNPVKVEEDR